MLDEYFKRNDVSEFIKELERNPRYLKMDIHQETIYAQHIKDELALYLFYDIVFKYKIIVDDIYLFDDFLVQIEKLFRKIDKYDDIVLGAQKLLIHFVATILDVHDTSSLEGRNKIISHFYQKYIMEGYFVHGFSTAYESYLKDRDFAPGVYPNYYKDMMKIQRILENNKIDSIEKDFSERAILLTDDFVMGCHYSVSSPGYFYRFVNQECKEKDGYLKHQFSSVIGSLKRFLGNHSVGDSERRFILHIVEEEWKLLHRVPRKVSLLFIKKSDVIDLSTDKLREYLESDISLEEAVERILSPKYNDISYDKNISCGKYQIVSLDDFYQDFFEKEEEDINDSFGVLTNSSNELINSNGMVSVLLIVGCLFITLGVVITIIMILRGM